MKKRLLAGLLATSIALSISMGAFPAMAATNDDFVEDREDIADYTDDSYSSGYSSSEQLFDDIIFFDLDEEVDDTAAEVIAEEDANDSSDTEIDRAADSIEETEPEDVRIGKIRFDRARRINRLADITENKNTDLRKLRQPTLRETAKRGRRNLLLQSPPHTRRLLLVSDYGVQIVTE